MNLTWWKLCVLFTFLPLLLWGERNSFQKNSLLNCPDSIVDNQPPIILIVDPIYIDRSQTTNPSNTGFPAVKDNLTPEDEILISYTDDSIKLDRDTLLRTWIVTDACGNSTTQIQTIRKVNRSDALTIDCSPDNLIIECQGRAVNRTLIESWNQNNLNKLRNACEIDSIDLNVSGAFGLEHYFNDYCYSTCMFEANYSINDSYGNVAYKRASFRIIDTTPPVINNETKYDTIECNDITSLFYWSEGYKNGFQNSAIDCSIVTGSYRGSFSYESSEENIKTFSTRNIFTVTDSYGNSASTTIILTVLDTTPPNISCSPISKIYDFQSQTKNERKASEWNETNISNLRNCSREYCSDVFITSDYDFNNLSSSCGNKDSLVVTYSISDGYNNVATRTATISFKQTNDYFCVCIEIQSSDNQLTISNLSAPNTITKVFDPNWQIISNCSGDCPETITIPDLIAGETYHTDIQFYDENWEFICEDKQDVEIIGGGSEPCDTSICAGDVVLRTQAEVDAFCGCEVIEGNVLIGNPNENNANTDIIDLSVFQKSKIIKGHLVVGNTMIDNFNNFSNLERIEDSFSILFNDKMASFKRERK